MQVTLDELIAVATQAKAEGVDSTSQVLVEHDEQIVPLASMQVWYAIKSQYKNKDGTYSGDYHITQSPVPDGSYTKHVLLS